MVKVISRFPHIGLLGIIVAFLFLATLHSIVVPITQGGDELAHYRYISFIAQTGRLPINFAEREQAWYRADWPPLYHLLVGWLVSPIDTAKPHLKDVGESPHRRLVGEIFFPRLIIYTEDVNWPWQDGILAWHIGRFISILFSAGALVFTYLTMLDLCSEGNRRGNEVQQAVSPLLLCSSAPLLAFVTTALLAFTPRYLFTSAMLGDDSLLVLLSAIFIWLLLRALRGDDRRWIYVVLGLTLGLSIATKYSTGLLPLVIIPVALWQARQADWPRWRWLRRVALAWGGTLIGAGWWFGWISYYFNTIKKDGLLFGLLSPLLNSGPDVSMRRLFAFFTASQFTGQERPGAIEAGTFWDWLTYLFRTFWGVPVLEHDPLYPWPYLLMLIVCLMALIGLWQLWQTAKAQTRVTVSVLALIVALLFPFPILRFFLTHNVLETGQGRHILYPAAQAIPVLLLLGWVTFAGRISEWRIANGRTTNDKRRTANNERRRRNPTARNSKPETRDPLYATRHTQHAIRPIILLLLPALLLLWSIFQLVYMTRIYPPPLPVRTTTFDATFIPRPLKHNFGDSIQLLGYDLSPDSQQAMLKLTLYWRSLKPVQENYRTQVELVDAGGSHLTWLSHPLNGRYPTRAWDRGDVIRDELSLPLAGMSPNLYRIQLNLLHEAEDTPLTGDPLTIAQFELTAIQPPVNGSTVGQIDYRLWVDPGKPARYRQTLPLSWTYHHRPPAGARQRQNPGWALVGPDDVPRLPAATGDASAIFIVGPGWPSGSYRLQVESGSERRQTEPLLTVANDFRLFDLPAGVTGREDWTPVEATFANRQGQPQVKLLGYVLPTRRVEPGDGLSLTLYWQSLAPVLGSYVMFDVLLDENQRVYGGYDRLPREYYSTILWAEGEVVEDGFAVPISPEAPPGVYNLHLGLYSLETGSPISLPLMQGGRPIDETSVVIGPIKVGGPPPGVTVADAEPQTARNVTLGEQINLLGFDGPVVNRQSKIVNLTLYWQALRPPDADYTTFVHLRDGANENVAQKDRPPANGRYPSSLWDVGEIIVDEITLPVAGVPPGTYTPVVGLYDFATGGRLPVEGMPDNELRLESVTLP